MIGDPDMTSVENWAAKFETYDAIVLYFLSQLPTGGCYKHLKYSVTLFFQNVIKLRIK